MLGFLAILILQSVQAGCYKLRIHTQHHNSVTNTCMLALIIYLRTYFLLNRDKNCQKCCENWYFDNSKIRVLSSDNSFTDDHDISTKESFAKKRNKICQASDFSSAKGPRHHARRDPTRVFDSFRKHRLFLPRSTGGQHFSCRVADCVLARVLACIKHGHLVGRGRERPQNHFQFYVI